MVSTEKILHLRTIKKEYITAEKLNRFRAKIPDGERRIGSLSYDWIKRIEKDKISDITRSACDVFEKFSIEIEDISNRYTGKVDKLENLKQAQSALLQSLQKILKRDDIDITYVGSGSLKHCQRLDVGKHSYAISTFKSEKSANRLFSDYFCRGHGKGNEPQSLFTLFKRGSHGRFVKPFLANLSGMYDAGGYILSKFIDENHPKKTELGTFLAERAFVYNTDPNIIRGISIESGGCIYNKKYIKDAKLRALWTKFAGILDGNIRLLKENKSAVKIQGFMLQGKELNAVSMEERRAAAKLARSLNKIKKLKAQQGYDEVKELLKKDFVDLFPYDEHSVEFGRMISWYPALLAKELGINNVPDFEDMTAISADHFDKVKIRFADYYPKSQIVEWLKENYDYERERNLLKIFREQYDIEDEVREMERQFSNPLPEQ